MRTQTAGVSGLGYTVHPIDLGGQFVAQVGPYADEATARRALADIRRAFPSAVLYPPRGVSLTGETAPAAQTPTPASTTQTPAAQAPAAQAPAVRTPAPVPASRAAAATPAPPLPVPASPEAAPAPPLPVPTTSETASAPAASRPTYLQVGAFDRVESAQTLVEQLRSQGFMPSVNAPEGRKVTVLVGPFSGTALTDAESKLSSAGHDSFRVR
ncbi:SPOR domain-containing protein [Deinococcus malanensis]|uniref:SPOR domain-containing protein n=1 Tax=Deinococcus malanensis TaxID=1706855 RepID=UPI00363F80CE